MIVHDMYADSGQIERIKNSTRADCLFKTTMTRANCPLYVKKNHAGKILSKFDGRRTWMHGFQLDFQLLLCSILGFHSNMRINSISSVIEVRLT